MICIKTTPRFLGFHIVKLCKKNNLIGKKLSGFDPNTGNSVYQGLVLALFLPSFF